MLTKKRLRECQVAYSFSTVQGHMHVHCWYAGSSVRGRT